MTGTAWTEPGQGATMMDLFDLLCRRPRSAGPRRPNGIGKARSALAKLAGGDRTAWSNRTNLRLTGEPLTAEDVARIAEAK